MLGIMHIIQLLALIIQASAPVVVERLPAITTSRDNFDWAIWGANLVLAPIGLIGACIAIATLRRIERQAKTAEDTLQLMNETAIRQLRAYISVDGASLRTKEANKIEASVTFKNCGQTPAYRVEPWISLRFEEHPLQIELPPPPADYAITKNTVGPQGAVTLTARIELLKMTDMILGTPACTAFVYGCVTYKDAFDKTRHTRLRLIYGGPEGTHSTVDKDGNEVMMLMQDGEGNDAD